MATLAVATLASRPVMPETLLIAEASRVSELEKRSRTRLVSRAPTRTPVVVVPFLVNGERPAGSAQLITEREGERAQTHG